MLQKDRSKEPAGPLRDEGRIKDMKHTPGLSSYIYSQRHAIYCAADFSICLDPHADFALKSGKCHCQSAPINHG